MFSRHPGFNEPVREWRPATDPEIPSQACCCPAQPMVKVVMPPAPGRPYPVELWLCGHHYRDSRAALLLAGARVEYLNDPRGADIEILDTGDLI
jgi:hypothetical protein